MELVYWIVGLAVVFLASQYVVGPVMVYFSQRLPEKYNFRLLDQEEFLSQRGAVFNKLHGQILSNDFRYAGSSEMLQSHSSLYFSVYYSEKRKLTCTLMTAHAAHHKAMTQIEFTQLYSDGTVLNVNNNAVFGAYPNWDIKEEYRYPEINDFSRLLNVMDKIIEVRKPSSTPLGMEEGSEFETIENHLNDEHRRLIDIGWVSPVIVNGEHRLTILGALIMTWKMCWPIKAIINKIDILKSHNVLKSA